MEARAALFDLYGDHLRERGGQAPVSAVIKMLDALDIAAPAARTAVSRMVRQGWLEATRESSGPGYRLTDRAWRRLDEAGDRIYGRSRTKPWDGSWSIVIVERTTDRSRRERLERGLQFLGYRQLHVHGTTWVSPQRSLEVESVALAEELSWDEFTGELRGEPTALVDRLYGLDSLAREYRSWLTSARELVAGTGDPAQLDDRAAFAARSRLVHEWRKFLFRDPGLPESLLPADWPGQEARRYFDAEAERLWPGASAFVDCCLRGKPHE